VVVLVASIAKRRISCTEPRISMTDRIKTFIRDLLRTVPLVIWFLLDPFQSKRFPSRIVEDPIQGPVLVFLTNAIGDSVLGLPALKSIIESQRPAKVDVLARPKTAPLFTLVPGVGNVFVLEKMNFPFTFRALCANVRTIRAFRRAHYETALVFSSNFWTAWVAFLVGAQKRLGFSRLEKVGLLKTQNFGFLLTHDKGDTQNLNYFESYMEFVQWLGISQSRRQFPRLDLSNIKENSNDLRFVSGKSAKPLVVLSPFTSQAIKDWPLESWIHLAHALAENSVSVVVCCEPVHADRLHDVFPATQSEIQLSANLGLMDFTSLLNRAAVVVTNDSGPLHLSYALGKRTICIFGPTDPSAILPKGVAVTVVRKNIECAPCYQLGNRDRCPLTHHRCLTEITPADVLVQVLLKLSDSAREKPEEEHSSGVLNRPPLELSVNPL
jgi:heptosyltransferase-2